MNNKSIGDFIKELRKEKNMSQQKLSELTRIDRTTIAKYETGEREPNYYNLEILSKVLNVSITELIAGGRKIDDYDKVDNAFKRMFVKMGKFKSIVKILISIFVITVISLIIYIFILNYTATRVYKVYAESDKIRITNGILVRTKDKIYLSFPIERLSEEVDTIHIYYKDGNKKEYIYKTSKLNDVYFSDGINIEEYKGSELNKILNNTYIELEANGKVIGVIKLTINFDYSNKKIDNENVGIESQNIDEDNIKVSGIYNIANNFMSENNKKIHKVKLNGINYEIYVIDNEIRIIYVKNNKEYTISYNLNHNEERISLQKRGKVVEVIYSYNLSEKICEIPDCNGYKKDLNLIKLLLEQLEK